MVTNEASVFLALALFLVGAWYETRKDVKKYKPTANLVLGIAIGTLGSYLIWMIATALGGRPLVTPAPAGHDFTTPSVTVGTTSSPVVGFGPTLTPSVALGQTPTQVIAPLVPFSPSPTPSSTRVPPGSNLVLIPQGSFWMGDEDGVQNERPLHPVYLDAYYIDRSEVTTAAYAECVAAGKCAAPSSSSSGTRSLYFGDPKFWEFPVVFVSWQDADSYCKFRRQRLPTEAEWEKAARSTERRNYPWPGVYDPLRLNDVNSQIGNTVDVRYYPQGASLDGALNMAGNVSEWVADWADGEWYASPDAQRDNSSGPAYSTGQKVIRGSSFRDGVDFSSALQRRRFAAPSASRDDLGFRCAVTAPP